MFTQRDLEWFFGPTSTGKVQRYPLTNIGTYEDETLLIELAIAGFDKNEVELELKGNQLHVIGKKEALPSDIKYIQQHISDTNFERILVLHENYVGGDIKANFKNGILSITVTPKEPTRKLIAIGS